jgi:hypothetical protein
MVRRRFSDVAARPARLSESPSERRVSEEGLRAVALDWHNAPVPNRVPNASIQRDMRGMTV